MLWTVFSLGALEEPGHFDQELSVQRVHHLGRDVLPAHFGHRDGPAHLHVQIYFVRDECSVPSVDQRQTDLKGVLQPQTGF